MYNALPERFSAEFATPAALMNHVRGLAPAVPLPADVMRRFLEAWAADAFPDSRGQGEPDSSVRGDNDQEGQ